MAAVPEFSEYRRWCSRGYPRTCRLEERGVSPVNYDVDSCKSMPNPRLCDVFATLPSLYIIYYVLCTVYAQTTIDVQIILLLVASTMDPTQNILF